MNSFLGRTSIGKTVAFAAGVAVLCLAAGARAAEPAADDLWLVSTRDLDPCGQPGGEQPRYWRLGQDRQWEAADVKAFLAGDSPTVPTAFFLHGNRTDRQDAVNTGWGVYRVLKEQAGGRAFRFVIWSWPSDRIAGGNRRDVRVKAARSETESYYLADCIRQINPAVPVSLIGYSFGARTIGGALNLLAGGEFAGQTLPQPGAAERTPLRAVLVAAAMDDVSFLPGGANGRALAPLDHLLVAYNPADPATRWYSRMFRGRGPEALGHSGPACPGRLGPEAEKMEQVNLCCEVGWHHKWECYLSASGLRSRLAWYAFLAPPAQSPATAVASATTGSGSGARETLVRSAPGRNAVRPQQ